jgi:hypothetical protein
MAPTDQHMAPLYKAPHNKALMDQNLAEINKSPAYHATIGLHLFSPNFAQILLSFISVKSNSMKK